MRFFPKVSLPTKAAVLFLGLAFWAFMHGCKNLKRNIASTPPIDIRPEQYAEHVRSTEFQSPEKQQLGFKLPPGFELTLFASEPQIGKPINMEFDSKGRLWVTQSYEYPMAAAPAKGHDKITILEDTDNDGKADKFTEFAEGLNIPIGILPYRKNDAIGFSIPNIYYFSDTNGDGKADSRSKILGEFGHKDTHGMVNNFISGFDGWINACHGFTNTSTVAGTDGDSITMVSGNTFRFKADGSRVEQTTYGRVNPFGFAYDEWGYLYSVDCHSKPVYQLIKGAEYPHFGKKSPAIGFAPEMMSYELGSTAISGLVYYTGTNFPEEYRNDFYNGDVVTARINRNSITFNGASPESKKEADFLLCSDPWFRPVDIKIGPDGAMYVADFYNRIIGHYEVPLNHPGRDRTSGRIWKITYVGNKQAKKVNVKNRATDRLSTLIKSLNHPQINIRQHIADEIVVRFKEEAVSPVIKSIRNSKLDPKAYVQSLWILHRLNKLPDNVLDKGLQHPNPIIQVHALRIVGDGKVNAARRDLIILALSKPNPHVQRVAAEVLSLSPDIKNVKPLLALYRQADEKDNHLKYTTILALRNNLRNNAVMQSVASSNWDNSEQSILLKVLLDVPTEIAASFALDYIKRGTGLAEKLGTYLEFIGQFVASNRLDEVIDLIQTRYVGDEANQPGMYETIRQGIAKRGGKVSDKMKDWGTSIAAKLIENTAKEPVNWYNVPLNPSVESANPWAVITRAIVGALPAMKMIWSEYNWYEPVGILRSSEFKLPELLKLNVFDNDIHNTEAKTGISKNSVRIRLASTGEIISLYRLNFPGVMDHKDLIKPVSFDLGKYKGRTGYIEVVDSTLTGSVGIAELNPKIFDIPNIGPGESASMQIRASEIAADLKAVSLEPAMKKILSNRTADYKARVAAANALVSISPEKNALLVGEVFNNLEEFPVLREKLAEIISQTPNPYPVLVKSLPGSRSLQRIIVTLFANSAKGMPYLIDALKAGNVEPEILSEPAIKERLSVNITQTQQQQLVQLTENQTEREDRSALIQNRIANYNPEAVTVQAGQAVFMQNCSMCHQIKSKGGMIGPQLDGIGNWGQKALTEKILDPNRNISESFRVYNVTLNNGKALSGLYRRDEGELMVFANPGGEEFSISKSEIKERAPSKYTLMPDHFSKVIAKKDFDALLKFLLSVR